MSVTLLCPVCRSALPHVRASDQQVRCPECGQPFPVRFGIVDLRGSRMRVAGAEFDAERDLSEAGDLHAALRGMSYRGWFFADVDRALNKIKDPRRRRHMRNYYRDERTVFGVHGDAILAKLDAYLLAREPLRFRDWRATASVALEAGCGTGQYPIGFAKRFRTVLVTDISYVSLVQAQKIAEEFGLSRLEIFASNIEDLPIRSGSVDFVHCNGVIEHVADPARVFSECARVLGPSGVALILSPNKYSLYTEAHFRIPAFGFWPMPIRRWLAYRASGDRSFAGTELRSLAELTRYARGSFAHFRVYMLPPRLASTARAGALRGAIRALLDLPLIGRLVDLVINRLLLPVMPYQVIVGFSR